MKKQSFFKRGTSALRAFFAAACAMILCASAAVMAGCLVNDSMDAPDVSSVKTLNEAVKKIEKEKGKAASLSELYPELFDLGYDVERLSESADGEILWHMPSNRFVLKNELGKNAYCDEDTVSTQNFELWRVVSSMANLSKKYGNYLVPGANFGTEINVSVGVDTGSHGEITKINFDRSGTAVTVCIVTASEKVSLKVNDSSTGAIYHYGVLGNLEIAAGSGYVEKGLVAYADVLTGTVTAAEGGSVEVAYVEGAQAVLKTEEGGVINGYCAEDADVDAINAYISANGGNVTVAAVSEETLNVKKLNALGKAAVAADGENLQGVRISGVLGYDGAYFESAQAAYETIKAKLTAVAGVNEETINEQTFNSFFTDGGKIGWTVYGNAEITDVRTFSFGRAANRFGDGLHITEIVIEGGNKAAAIDLTQTSGSFALPYNWWEVEGSVNTALKCKNVAFNGIKAMPSGTYENNLYATVYEFENCTFNGNLYSYQNFKVDMTIKNCTFNAPESTQYAFMSQGAGGTITLSGCTFNGYTRGVNFQRPTADFVFTDNKIISTVSESDRGAVQLTDGKSFVVNNNVIDVNAGNAFWFHSAATNENVTYVINGNDIKAPYIGYSAITSFDVNSKITSSGNNFNQTDIANCMKKDATVAEATNLTAIK